MPSRKTHERRLSKLAARRAAERRRKRRQRIVAGSVGAAVALAGLGFGSFVFLRGGSEARPGAASTPSATSTASAGGVACAAERPRAASVKKPSFKKPPPLSIDPRANYTVTVRTSCGTFKLGLFARQAPVTVNSFVFLARRGFYDGLTFHRIAKDPAVIQGGDPKGNGTGGPGYTIKEELKNALRYEVGVLAMAKAQAPHTTGSQFFIVTGETGTRLPKQYTIFGKVVSGMDVVERIYELPTGGQTGEEPLQKVYMEKVTITEA